MIPPKYNFYIGKADSNIYFSSRTEIDNSGNFDYGADSDKYATNYENMPNGKNLFIDLQSSNSYSALFFYDKNKVFISCMLMSNIKSTVIVPPTNAKYYAMRFSATDEIFMLKRNTDFVYYVESVNPHYKDLSKKYAKESGQEFFRESLDGKINLFGEDYEIIANSSLEDKLIFIIDKYNTKSNRWVEYYKGEFNKTDCKFDYGKKKCELKTTAIDNYSEIMNNYENTYDLIKLTPEISKINLHKRPLMQVYVRGANSISNFFGGIYWEDDVNKAIDDHNTLVNKYYFAYIKAGNELYVRNAKIAEVNGIYAGTNGDWDKWEPGFHMYAELESSNDYRIFIKRNSDQEIMYKSNDLYVFSDSDNKYLSPTTLAWLGPYKFTNIHDSTDVCEIYRAFTYHTYRRLLCDVDTVEDSEGVKNTYKLPSDDFVTDNRNYKRCIGLRGGMFFCTSRAVDKPTKYGLNDYNQYFTNEFIPSEAGIGRPLPISRNSWANASLWYVYDSYYKFFEERLRKQYTLKDSYSISAVIKALLNKIDPTLKHEGTAEYSRFLYDANMPMSMTRFYVNITQKTNILKGEYDQPAQKAEISLEEVMKMLRDCFRCYWYIEDGKFKIEHISFFMKGGSYLHDSDIQLDFTKLTDQFNKKPASYFQSEVEYDKSDLNSRYEFGWMDDVTDLFGGVTIDVKSNYIQKDKNEEISINQFSSDIDYMLFNPHNFSDDGFALLCPIKNGSSLEIPIIETQLIDENGDIYDAIIQNFYASWAYLVRFYMYDMPAQSIECNVLDDNLHTQSVKMCKKHTIEFPTEEDLDKLELIKTSIGNGKIDEVSININTRVAKVKLMYKP